jgi:GntR family transcriptional repressor for pyruvate dehydrogenase complex
VASRRPAFRAIADDLAARCADGTLTPGSALPPELELARHYGVSRSTLREALRILSAQGLIVTRRGTQGGSFVTGAASESTGQPDRGLTLRVTGSPVGVPEIIATRTLFDVPAAKEAARKRTADDLSRLRRTLDVPYEGLVQSDSFELHWKFHDVLYRIGNPLIAAVAYPLACYAQENCFKYYTKGSAERSHADHEEIFAAIAAGDIFETEVSMIRHLERLELVHGKAA